VKHSLNKTRSFQVFVLLTGFILLTSCDPMKNILISNQTGENVNVVIIQDTTNQLSLGSETQVKFSLSTSGDSSSRRYIYGFGMFSEEELQSFNDMIKLIQIEGENDTCVIEGDDLLKVLPKKRHRLFKSELEIKIKNCPQQGI
jgi:hypothetical protein